MDGRSSVPLVPLHLTSLAILSPTNQPLYVHSFTGAQDELRHYHLSHAALDVVEERIVMTSTPTKPADSYLGLLFCMEDMAFYGFQTPTKLRMILSVALVDALIKDSDIVAIFRAVHQLLLATINNPFQSLPPSFRATPAVPPVPPKAGGETVDDVAEGARAVKMVNPVVPTGKMFLTDPDEIEGDWLRNSARFQTGIKRIGQALSGGR